MNSRVDKLNSEFKRYIAEILAKKVKDPRITELYTIIDVNCDKELSTAKVYISIFSTDVRKSAETFDAIKDNAGFIRHEISKNMHIRKVPEFEFILDTSMAYGQKIDELLNEINKENR